jgi:hypothetical protein
VAQSLRERLAGRKLVQWAIAYLAGAWLALQVLDMLRETFAWPLVVEQVGFAVAVAGFLATLVLAWYHGERGMQRVSGPELLIIATLLTIAGASVAYLTRSPDQVVQQANTNVRPLADATSREPLVVLMDSPHPARVYDTETLAFNGTNADVVSDILLDLPIRRQKETIGPIWHREEEIRQFEPTLIVIHYSGFCQETCEDRTRLAQLVEYFADTDTRFLIYGRWVEDELRMSVDELLANVERKWPGTLGRVEVFGLDDYGSPHWRDPATAGALKLRVKRILGLT